jgi:hypothetical protein
VVGKKTTANFTFTRPVHRRGRKSGSLPGFHAESGGTKNARHRKTSPASQMEKVNADALCGGRAQLPKPGFFAILS